MAATVPFNAQFTVNQQGKRLRCIFIPALQVFAGGEICYRRKRLTTCFVPLYLKSFRILQYLPCSSVYRNREMLNNKLWPDAILIYPRLK